MQSIAPTMTRRAAVAGACGAACVAALAACSGSGSGGGAAGPAPATAGPGDPAGSAGSAPTGGAGASGGGSLVSASEVPVGGGVVLADQDVVVTQPTAGEFTAFSATCTHQGCTVGDVSGGTINCPCHGSRFSIADGSVADGPADSPLPQKDITVDGDTVVLA
jgi:Rieske Fe-S protein